MLYTLELYEDMVHFEKGDVCKYSERKSTILKEHAHKALMANAVHSVHKHYLEVLLDHDENCVSSLQVASDVKIFSAAL